MAPPVAQVLPSGTEATVYALIALEPGSSGASQVTATFPSPGEPVTFVGRPGTGSGVTELEALDAGPVPMALVAVTVKV